MKKLISFTVIAILAAGVSFAQGIQDDVDQANASKRNPAPRTERQRAPQQQQRKPQQRQQREIETVTVSGPLKLENGIVAVQSGEKTHLIPMLNRYIGFITGLQEGKTVSVEGFAGRNMLHPKKLTIDGKEYDFSKVMYAQNMPRQHGRKDFRAEPHRHGRPGEMERNRSNRRHNDNRRKTTKASAVELL